MHSENEQHGILTVHLHRHSTILVTDDLILKTIAGAIYQNISSGISCLESLSFSFPPPLSVVSLKKEQAFTKPGIDYSIILVIGIKATP